MLEALQSEHEIKKAELVRKLALLAQQVGRVEEKTQRLQLEEEELQTKLECLAQLKSPRAQEAEEVVKQQESEQMTSVQTRKVLRDLKM